MAVIRSAMEKACDHFVSRGSQRDVRVSAFFISREKALSEDLLKAVSNFVGIYNGRSSQARVRQLPVVSEGSSPLYRTE